MSPSLGSRTVKTGPVRSHKYVVVSSYEKYKNSQNSKVYPIWSAFQKVKEVILLSSTSNYERSTIFMVSSFHQWLSRRNTARLPGKPDNPNGRSHGMLGVDGASVPDSARGTYLWNGLCEDCIEGAICEGSRTLAVYFQRLESPRLAIPSNP